ncbi:DUF4105 domain-containing protein [Spirosoma taeanense]|uniref:DUF4105 domain-containing protein n=1 Tax=Spirosoma taeanense TaxID=2735870 RepID=A0A6M5YB73_9BACT|nr:DUF4105 domain-containing protein [Spirosoma taeanense]QJW90132.1 DUF4105 domain-containing protein [Spirosoma taeanense]
MTKSASWLARIALVLALTVFGLRPGASIAQTLSPAARISLLTVGPGEDLYSVFGHTAIRINDPAQNMDLTFGWGGFRYEDNFYVKFLRGTLPYYIDAYEMYPFLYAYQVENRTVREQVLNLTPAQKEQLFAVIQTNMRPENRTYQYKFFYDNCATRPRDKIAEACGDSLTIPTRLKMTGKSYRDWMNLYLDKSAKPWAKLGMNLAIGQPADEQTDGWHAMYLPDQVHDQLARATLKQTNGQVVPLVASDQTLYNAQQTFRQQLPFVFDPHVVFALLAIVVTVFTIRRYQIGRVDRWLDRLLFAVVGFLGWFLFLLWVATDHGVTAWNPTLLYLMPLHLPLIYWATGRNTTARRRTVYFGSAAVLILLGMFLSKVPGGVDVLFPLTLLVRCIVNLQPVRRGQQMPARVA